MSLLNDIISGITFDYRKILPDRARRFLRGIVNAIEVNDWEKRGKPSPPPHVIKINTLREYKDKYQIDTFIETGTFMGDTIDVMKDYFTKVYSIELDKYLCVRARKIFSKNKNVKVYWGDSGVVIKKLIKDLDKPTLFWLDAHYSGGVTAKGVKDTPIMTELTEILKSKIKGHIVLIDDARLFTGKNSYPKLSWMRKHLKENYPKKNITVKNDLIRII